MMIKYLMGQQTLNKIRVIPLVFILSVCSQTVSAATVSAIALFKDRAMLSIDGSKAKIIKAGANYKGVKLLSSNTSEAVIEVAGVRKTLRLNGTANLNSALGGGSIAEVSSVTMQVNGNGFFRSLGQVNGRSIDFLIDTGANLVVFNSRQAQQLNIDYLNGRRGYASTASGRATMYSVTLKDISLGGIRLKDVEAGVIEGDFPEVPLLGMTFLQRLDMTRSGRTMVLKKR